MNLLRTSCEIDNRFSIHTDYSGWMGVLGVNFHCVWVGFFFMPRGEGFWLENAFG